MEVTLLAQTDLFAQEVEDKAKKKSIQSSV